MPYSEETYAKARRILKKRADDAEMAASIRSEDIKEKLPEVDDIQKKLSKIGLEISKIFFYQGDKDARIAQLRQESRTLVKKRGIILSQNGYSPDAMQAQYVCTACHDSGFINGRMCSCHRQLLKDIMRAEVSRFAPLDKCTFDNFNLEYYSTQPLDNSIVPRAKAEKVFDTARKYAQNFTMHSKNLMFIGGTGLGKTHLSLAIANVVINRGYSVCYGTSQNICDDLQSEQFGRGENTYYSKEMVLSADLLVLDDLGTEIDNQYSIAIIYNIINSRILSGRPAIISTNFNIPALERRYDKRITSRITGEYVKFHLFGNDIRNI